MAVTIDNMQVDVQDRAPQTPSPSDSSPTKPPLDIRKELRMRTERELRLNAD